MRNKRLAIGLSALLIAASPVCTSAAPSGNIILSTSQGTTISKGAAAAYLRYTQAQTYNRYTMYYNIYERDIGQFWSAKNSDGKTNSQLLKDTIKNDLEIIAASKEHADEYGVKISEKEMKRISQAADEFISQTDEGALKADDISKESVEEFLLLDLAREKVKAKIVKDTDRKVSTKEKQQCSIDYFIISDEKLGKKNTEEKINEKLAGPDAEAFYKSVLVKAGEGSETSASFSYYSYTDDYSSGTSSLPLSVMKAASALINNQYAAVQTSGMWYFIRMKNTDDREATKNKEEEIVRERADELFDSQAEKWVKDAGVKFNDQMWYQMAVNDTVVYQPYEEDEKTNISQTESTTESAIENATEGTTENN